MMLARGRVYSFRYPRHNFYGVKSGWEQRRVIVIGVRDLRSKPIEDATFEANPLLRRGRWLIECVDLDKAKVRSFYACSMRDVRREWLPGE